MAGYYHDYLENRELKNAVALQMVQRHLLIIPILKIMDNETALRALFSLYSVLLKKILTSVNFFITFYAHSLISTSILLIISFL